jgi:RHS repeat-associated protein
MHFGEDDRYFSYDNRDRLISAKQEATDGGTLEMQATYVYDALGNRAEKDVWTSSNGGLLTVTRFAYDQGNVWADLNGSNQLQMRRLYLDTVDSVFARISSGGTAAWYLPDHLGSVRDIIDSPANNLDHVDYDAFGNVTNETQSSNGDRYKWTGRELDTETGCQYNRARYYNPGSGRWTSQDPRGFGANDPDLYRYVRNSPLTLVDPSGLWEIKRDRELQAIATTKDGDTAADLAMRIGLSANEFQSWLGPMRYKLVLENGRLIFPDHLTASDPLRGGQRFVIPNVIYSVYALCPPTDYLGGNHRTWVANNAYLESIGFRVISFDLTPFYPRLDGAAMRIVHHDIGVYSSQGLLQGIYELAHGNADLFCADPPPPGNAVDFIINYNEVRRELSYKLGFAVLDSCSK